MGRVAGPVIDGWKKSVRQKRREKALAPRWVMPPMPYAQPPAHRRLLALLWFIEQYHSDRGLIVGLEGWPPLTRDMRLLIGRRHLVLARRYCNRLKLTEEGRRALSNATISERDKAYVLLSVHHACMH